MSVDAMAHGAFVFPSEAAAEQAWSEAEDWLLEQDDAARLAGAEIVLTVNMGFSNEGYLDFFEWLDSAAEEAVAGSVDMWSEHIEGEGFDRIHPGGRVEAIPTPYPHSV